MQDTDVDPTLRDELLEMRASLLGLALDALETGGVAVDTIRRQCKHCAFGKACELDLRRDPNDPVWETYCPNTATLIALARGSAAP
ncbi:MAG: hypothetical protein ABSE22_00630 [Xanthobacteraceae bacterium]|jgi:hypothetical protein